jgi:tetratricopeptide (TPR) repeat protein
MLMRVEQLHPGEIPSWALSWAAIRTNRPGAALEFLGRIPPPEVAAQDQWTPYWNPLTTAHHLLGDHDSELREVRRYREAAPDDIRGVAGEVRALGALGRVEELRSILEEAKDLRTVGGTTPGLAMRLAGLELMAHGHLEAGAEFFDAALDWYREREAAGEDHREYMAWALYYLGRHSEIEPYVRSLHEEDPEVVNYLGWLGIVAARTGERTEAHRISAELEAWDDPLDFGWSTYWRADIAAILGDAEGAIRLLREAYDQGYAWSTHWEADIDLLSLQGIPDFEAFMRPKG